MKKNKLTDNLFLRILAVIVAVLVWIIVVNVSDPIIESTYSGVPVEILNGDLISKQNETYEILNGSSGATTRRAPATLSRPFGPIRVRGSVRSAFPIVSSIPGRPPIWSP